MDAPQCPHPLGEMWVKMAVEDRIPHRPVAVARAASRPFARLAAATAVIDIIGESLLRTDRLAVQIAAPARIVAGKPLMGVQVENMGLLRPGVEIAKHHRVVQIGMVHIRRVVIEPFQQRRIAIHP